MKQLILVPKEDILYLAKLFEAQPTREYAEIRVEVEVPTCVVVLRNPYVHKTIDFDE